MPAPNETVEKPYFPRADPAPVRIERPCIPRRRRLCGYFTPSGVSGPPHFPFRAQGEAVHALVHTDVGEDRFPIPSSTITLQCVMQVEIWKAVC
jgi:hypothetical protein